MTSTSLPELVKNLTDQEKKITENINLFNDKYAHYVRCYGNTADAGLKVKNNETIKTTYPNLSDTKYCSAYTVSYPLSSDALNDLKSMYDNVLTEIAKGNAIIHDIANQNNNADYKNITTTYNKNLNIRNEMDLKIKEIYEENGTTQRNLKIDHDSTVYASIAWSVLATSLIYYVFVKL